MSDKISRSEAKEQVVLMAKRTAMLYQSFAETLVNKFGSDDAEKIILEAINLFGKTCGERIQNGVRNKGLELTITNFYEIPDLPKLGWELSSETVEKDKEQVVDVSYCPLAEQWLEGMDPKLARLYCYVDQAKFSTYNPEIKCTHTNNMLDGDDKCTLLIQNK
ncbi:hypothetical protein GOM49_04920 [Clostridium bovifaecis]|uniref:L-2-amino-thiazoline-4-carboxylic acid hydrolase n=1 Tax=Clostridium bovifaecis TaxID=2184719 RepID=A0A6I6EUJ0_9CLOT|nr:hypothetical protein GOM49_04920 [Clostridium bovifaecis]